tara:strand:- start:1350 stop:1640 length:291 start_codon:yes stop_codon:yes gene_type:complete
MRKIITIILFISFGLNSFGQTSDDKSEAYDIAKEAIKIMDNGEIEKSIEMLKKAHKLDPENYLYPYEIGYAYLLQKDYKNAIKTLKPVLKYQDNND